MPRVKPAIMHGPDHRLAALCQIAEKYLVVKEIAVDVVYVDDIRVQTLDCLYKALCSNPRTEPVSVEQTGFQTVQCHAQATADRQKLRSLQRRSRLRSRHTVPPPAISHPALPAAGCNQLSNLLHYLPGGSVPADYRIDLQQLRHPYTHLTIFP